MSSSMNLETDAIQHIDDACEEEYIESFAPKAQEEVLSEIQTGDSDLNSNQNEDNTMKDIDVSKNIADEMGEKSESEDISNEEQINATSNELVHEVMTEVESNMVVENEQISNVPVDEVNEDENIDDKTANDERMDKNLNVDENGNEKNSNEEIINIETSESANQLEEETVDLSESADIINSQEIVDVPEEVKEEKVDDISIEFENQDTDIQPEISTSTDEISEKEKNQSSYSPTRGKDVKSLSSTYDREDNSTSWVCYICNKKVYPMEKLSTNDKTFHKTCFRCTKCKSALSAGNFSFNHGRPYCTPHYVELFKKRGRYDEIDDNIEIEIPITNDINDVLTDELPAPDTTKNILAKFRDLQTGSTVSANQNINIDSTHELPAPNTTKNLMERFSALSQEKSEGKCKPKIDIPRHSNGHSNGTSENVPVELPSDVVRANDPSQDNRPEQGITKNLVNRFRELESSSNN